ncbi:phosphate-starvation-inducible PsiE family protein [Thiobacillus denitrificans]|uniref:Membrane protein n=1 Tax=Thiobacillus denitrificans TaxID=36861 RepID=A0A106BQ97_THIDE|nr:phosphate-starvation-inducible PsiE family protein [Thiobacillus denitrificans]KVW96660.1 membrane protein [Thiobacillus denitrificans]
MNQNTDSSPSLKLVDDPLIRGLTISIRYAVRILAVLMVLVIWWGVADVVYVLYERISTHPYYLLNISDIFATFGAFMAVLIAIEIFINIASYLRENVIHIKLVLATAFMAVARKVIVLDYKEVSAEYVFATAALVLALSVAYWLAVVKNTSIESHGEL